MAEYHVHGFVEEGFESVKSMFEKNFSKGMEKEAQLCVYVGEENVIDLWGGSEISTNYDGDSLAPVFSSGKSLASLCMAMLVEKKLLNYSDKVVDHWPEFGKGDRDKESLTIAQILKHEGGMPYFSKSLTLADLQPQNIKQNSIGHMIQEESLTFPLSSTNTNRQYHSMSRGNILNEIFRRVDPNGRTIGECLRSDISIPLNADAYIGLHHEKFAKVAEISALPPWRVMLESMKLAKLGRKIAPNLIEVVKFAKLVRQSAGDQPPYLEEFGNKKNFVPELISLYSKEEMRTCESPSINAFCSARGLARIAAMMANKGTLEGVQIFSEETWNSIHGDYEMKRLYPFIFNCCFSQGGVNRFHIDDLVANQPYAYREGYVGWLGLGGSVFQWHPEFKVGFSYVPTLIAWEDLQNTKAAFLQKEVINCLKRISRKKFNKCSTMDNYCNSRQTQSK